MSDHRALAATSWTLRHVLSGPIAEVVPGATVTLGNPDALAGRPGFAGVNVFLLRVSPDPGFRSYDLPTVEAGGRLVRPPVLALGLDYLLTFHGSQETLVPQLLLGRTATVLHGLGGLSRAVIQDALSEAPELLRTFDLGLGPERMQLSQQTLDLEALSHLWSNFFQTPYVLSMVWSVSTVMLEAAGAPVPRPSV